MWLVGVVVVTGAFLVVGSGDAVGSLPMRFTVPSTAASLVLGCVLLATLAAVRDEDGPFSGLRRTSAPAWGAIVLPAMCLVLLVITPRRFDSIAREDGFVEWISALATGCGVVWALMAARHRRGLDRALIVSAAAALFVLTGEELSWLQRLGQFGTPDVLVGNSQGEANFHNLDTDAFQALYYLATATAFLLVPFAARWTRVVPTRLRWLVPGPTVVVLAAASSAFAYARTGNLGHHVALWIAAGVLLLWDRRALAPWCVAAVLLVGTAQVLLMLAGPDLARPWAPDEYREMLLGVALAVWARQVLIEARSPRQVESGAGGLGTARLRPIERNEATERTEAVEDPISDDVGNRIVD